MRSPIVKAKWSNNALRRFARNRRGSAAVQFALVAPMFFAMLFAIVETCLVFFAGQVLETGTQDAARLIFTGQAKDQGAAAAQQAYFKTKVCEELSVLFECNKLAIEVKAYPSFSSVPAIADPISTNPDGSKSCNETSSYQASVSGSIVVVRVFYEWPLFVTSLGYNISSCGNKRLLSATAAFRNEPFGP